MLMKDMKSSEVARDCSPPQQFIHNDASSIETSNSLLCIQPPYCSAVLDYHVSRKKNASKMSNKERTTHLENEIQHQRYH